MKLSTLNFKLSTKRGFTLVETLVALAIFTASIVGLIAVTASGVANTNFAKNKLTASYLAQEGIELVRNLRDSAVISEQQLGQGWNNFLGQINNCLIGQNSSVGCNIDPININLVPVSCSNIEDCRLYRDGSGFFRISTQGTGATPFTRTIIIQELQTDVEVKVTSTVTWQQGGTTRNVTMTENLYNWIEVQQ